MGYPMIVVIGRKAADQSNPIFELFFTQNNTHLEIPLPELLQNISEFVDKHSKLEWIECCLIGKKMYLSIIEAINFDFY